MRKKLLLAVAFGVWICALDHSRVVAQPTNQPQATLYSPNKYPGRHKNACLNLVTGGSEPDFSHPRCDIRYGGVYVNQDLDWFQSALSSQARTLIRDLGKLDWGSRFNVPEVTPLPKVKPGEERVIYMNFDGADGAQGAAGLPGLPAGYAQDSSAPMPKAESNPAPVPSDSHSRVLSKQVEAEETRKANQTLAKKRGADPPVLVKAELGHIYVIHVVDETNDFYALFRVDALERGDNCTISWRAIPAPQTEATGKK